MTHKAAPRRSHRLRRSGGSALLALAVAYPLALRPWRMRWGATAAEAAGPLPGDDLVAHPWGSSQSTRAITIAAPPERIWPWLVQIGQGRGGPYSYDWLENLVGCAIHSADRVLPQFQHLCVGDQIRLYREGAGPPPYVVALIEPRRALVLGHRERSTYTESRGRWVESWALILVPLDAQRTRLISRRRWEAVSWANVALNVLAVEPANFVMEQQMLRGIKQRAEHSA